MKRWGLILCLAMAVLLGGCRRRADTTVQRNVITQVTITWQSDAGLLQRHYTSQEKMRSVLLYIRSVSPRLTASEAPEDGEQVTITTVSADRTTKTYHQQGRRYFKEGDGDWKLIDPSKGENLWRLIHLLPSDE